MLGGKKRCRTIHRLGLECHAAAMQTVLLDEAAHMLPTLDCKPHHAKPLPETMISSRSGRRNSSKCDLDVRTLDVYGLARLRVFVSTAFILAITSSEETSG